MVITLGEEARARVVLPSPVSRAGLIQPLILFLRLLAGGRADRFNSVQPGGRGLTASPVSPVEAICLREHPGGRSHPHSDRVSTCRCQISSIPFFAPVVACSSKFRTRRSLTKSEDAHRPYSEKIEQHEHLLICPREKK
jgi:hypothetical protein